MIPFISRIFDIDICSEVTSTSLGSIRGYCPEMCRVGGCGASLSSYGRPDTDWPDLYRWQYLLGLTGNYRVIFPRLGCGQTLYIPVDNFVFPERPGWSNGSYTLNFCNNTHTAYMRYGYSEMGSGMVAWGPQGDCETRIQIAPTFDADRVFVGIGIASWPHSEPQPGSALATLICHTDGELICPQGQSLRVLEDSTVGAYSHFGATAGERIYNFPSTAIPLLDMRFSTCGSQLDARLSVYRYPNSIHGGRVTIPDSVETPCPSGGGTQLTLAAPPDSHQYFLVVEGPGSSEGGYRLATDCWFPAIQCGDVVEGSTEGLPSYFGGVSGERIWNFVSDVSRTVTFDACGSNVDSDLRLFDQQMQELAYNDYWNTTQCGYNARIVHSVAPNQVFLVLLEGFQAAAGNFSLRVTCNP
uniref:Uncharacterized protein n=1 Tax=Alexandrium andersonii TaxID=327968 RepID=A0A7S2B5A0_9DINO|mmetsp:Transcript_21795/g.49657  ORF Transcript_21795/g.49657 Transcript_21795/m.49657 type:complete len:413 (+) Transcript_21795:2-1240(+)